MHMVYLINRIIILLHLFYERQNIDKLTDEFNKVFIIWGFN